MLLIVYGLSATGMTLHAHFCCGELEKLDFCSGNCKNDCATQTEVNGKSCCDEKQVTFSLSSEYNNANFILSFEIPEAVKPVSIDFEFHPIASAFVNVRKIFEPPPQRSLHILNSVYRI
jgi:hypothetical protein